MKYKCITKCFYNNRLYIVGESLTADKGNKPPKHFVPSSEFSKPLIDPKVQDQRALEAVGHSKNTEDTIKAPKLNKKGKGKVKDEEDFLK